jgi:hypothetical protein
VIFKYKAEGQNNCSQQKAVDRWLKNNFRFANNGNLNHLITTTH